MQSVSSRIWTHVVVPISCEDNYYTTGTSTLLTYAYKSYKSNELEFHQGPF